jgi:hypothetical protein
VSLNNDKEIEFYNKFKPQIERYGFYNYNLCSIELDKQVFNKTNLIKNAIKENFTFNLADWDIQIKLSSKSEQVIKWQLKVKDINSSYNLDHDIFSTINLSIDNVNLAVTIYNQEEYNKPQFKYYLLFEKIRYLVEIVPNILEIDRSLVERNLLFGINDNSDKEKHFKKVDDKIDILTEAINKIDNTVVDCKDNIFKERKE